MLLFLKSNIILAGINLINFQIIFKFFKKFLIIIKNHILIKIKLIFIKSEINLNLTNLNINYKNIINYLKIIFYKKIEYMYLK